MRKVCVLLSALAMSAGALQAQPAPMPQAAKAYPLVSVKNMPSNFFMTRLPNGLEVLVIEDRSVPLATIELVVRNGAFVQTPDLEGLAHLYEHMFFKANRDYPSQEAYLDRINELGISFNGTTSEERVNYYITLNKSKLNEGLQFMNASARYPKFLKEEMVKEDTVVAGEFQRNESSPFFFLLRDMGKRMWGKEYSRKNTIGEYPVILNATPEIMQGIKDRYYYPNNSILVVAGDVSHNDVFGQVEGIYGDWKPSSFNIWEKYPIPEFDKLQYSTSFVTESSIAQVPVIARGWHGPDTRGDLKATYAADVFSYILSQQGSKLSKALVESGLAYQVNMGYQTSKYTGPIQLVLVPNPAQVSKAMQVMEEQIDQWKNLAAYITDEQIETAKKMLEIDDKYGKEATSSYVHTVTFWWASASLDYYTNYINNIKAVTRQDMQDYVNKYILGKPSVTGVLINPAFRQMLKLDEFFPTTDSIQNLRFSYADAKATAPEAKADGQIKSLAGLLRFNPGRKVTMHVYAPKQATADTRVKEITRLLATNGIEPGTVSVEYHIKKDKELTDADKAMQNTVRFSFNNM